MEKMVRMHEQFCGFHQIYLNKSKCDYMVVNGKKGSQVTWKKGDTPTTKEKRKQGEMDKYITRTPKEETGRELKTTGEIGTPKRGDGRVVKYLGVWFEAAKGWNKQKEETDKKVRHFVQKLRGTNVSLSLAVYGINAKVIPAITYPLQVAHMSRPTLKEWDAKIRAVIKNIGGLPTGIPPDVYHLPEEEGGLGLVSIEDRVDANRIIGDMQARNDHIYKKGKKKKSIQNKVTTAAKERHEWTRPVVYSYIPGASRLA